MNASTLLRYIVSIITLSLSTFLFSQPIHQNFAAAETDVHYQQMHVMLDPAVNKVEGDITFYFSSRIPDLSRLIVDYRDALTVHDVRRNNQDLEYTHENDLITIDLGKILQPGEQDTIVISFSSENTLRQALHAGAPVISTDLDLGALWYPGKRDLVDKIDSVDIYITTPPDQHVAGNGELVSITEDATHWIHHWKHRYPVATTYLLNLAITNYTVVEDSVLLQNGSMLPLLHYLYPESLAAIVPEVEATPEVMQLFESYFGPYPFADEKYGHAQYTAGGALEVQTMPFMGFFNLDVIAHELAHQWFGNMVTFGSWSDIWLSEGMAEYLAGLAIEVLDPGNWSAVKNEKINSVTSQPGGSVYVEDTNDLNEIFDVRLTYHKGFYLAHMLRWIVGDSLFFEACRNYLYDPAHQHGFARTIDFQNHLEAVSNIDLDEFFEDWFYGQGYPSYTLTWEEVQDSVIIVVDQAQSDPSVSFFEMPIHVAASRFGIVADSVFQNTHNHQRFALYVGANDISQIIFDREKWILSRFNKIIHGITAIPTSSNDERITIYPNPATSFIEISGNEFLTDVEIISVTGSVLRPDIINGLVSVEGLPAGYYRVVIRDRVHGLVYSKGLVIQR